MPLKLALARRTHRRPLFASAVAGMLLLAVTLPGNAEEFPQVLEGKAALAHPAGKAVVEAAKLVHAGKLAAVKKASVKEVREEWAAMSAAEQRDETARAQGKAPEPKAYEAELAKGGILTIYGETASFSFEVDGDVTSMAFVALEGGKWKVTGGPMTFAPTPKETAPAITGASILEHEIGKLALEYAKRLAAGKMDAAIELVSGPARAKRAAESAAERKESDAFRTKMTPPPTELAEAIRAGGTVSFYGEKAFLNVVQNVTTKNADGSITSTSTSSGLPFELLNGKWYIGD